MGLSSLWLLAARLAGQALGLLFTAAIARSLGQAGLGQFAFISAVVLIGNAATTFGLDTLLIRDVAAARAAPDETTSSVSQTISAVLLIQLTLAAVFVAGLWPVSYTHLISAYTQRAPVAAAVGPADDASVEATP